ncbi:hypothetical protein AAIP36_002475 [Flavobacterium psychrophilum]|nr:hypothetical protein [Flavobacterium psychrophilum]
MKEYEIKKKQSDNNDVLIEEKSIIGLKVLTSKPDDKKPAYWSHTHAGSMYSHMQ